MDNYEISLIVTVQADSFSGANKIYNSIVSVLKEEASDFIDMPVINVDFGKIVLAGSGLLVR